MIVVPPGGFAGFAQQTPATQALFQRAGRTGMRTGTRRKRRTKAKRASAPKRKTTRRARAKRPARLVKGSRAAKAYMAKIRRKRK
jgi:hypothetical protein